LTLLSVIIAMSSEKIYGLVGDASAFGLVSLFLPFTAALFFGYNNRVGAVASMVMGSSVWLFFRYFYETSIDPLVFGFVASLACVFVFRKRV
jgi:solute:Na+ symporter, SSS family